MEGKLKSVEERVAMGKAEVKAVFGSGKKKVAGCAVLSGKLIKGAQVRLGSWQLVGVVGGQIIGDCMGWCGGLLVLVGSISLVVCRQCR